MMKVDVELLGEGMSLVGKAEELWREGTVTAGGMCQAKDDTVDSH